MVFSLDLEIPQWNPHRSVLGFTLNWANEFQSWHLITILATKEESGPRVTFGSEIWAAFCIWKRVELISLRKMILRPNSGTKLMFSCLLDLKMQVTHSLFEFVEVALVLFILITCALFFIYYWCIFPFFRECKFSLQWLCVLQHLSSLKDFKLLSYIWHPEPKFSWTSVTFLLLLVTELILVALLLVCCGRYHFTCSCFLNVLYIYSFIIFLSF